MTTNSSNVPGAEEVVAVGPLSTPVLVIGVTAGMLALVTSLLGLFTAWPYATETASWQLQARGQDTGNLLAVGALLIGGLALRRGRLAGWVLWLGALLYLVYAFVIYAFGVHFGLLFPAYVAVLGLAAYALLFSFGAGLANIGSRRSDRFAAGLVSVIAVAFALLWLSSIISDLVAGRIPASVLETGLPTNQVHVLDLALVVPGMLISVVGSRRFGRALLLGAWLVFDALMSASIVATMLVSAAPAALVATLATITILSAAAATWQVWERRGANLAG
jgi:hypothetical protein